MDSTVMDPVLLSDFFLSQLVTKISDEMLSGS